MNGAANHEAWKAREAAQAAAGYYNDSSVDLTPRGARESCHICSGSGGQDLHCIACNGRGTVWVETIEVKA